MPPGQPVHRVGHGGFLDVGPQPAFAGPHRPDGEPVGKANLGYIVQMRPEHVTGH